MAETLFDVQGAAVLVTGGSRGIGRFIAEAFVAAGARVFIAARDAERCDRAAAELSKTGRCTSLPADLSTIDGASRLVEQLATHTAELQVLVNNAGATWADPLPSYPEEQWDQVLDVNLKAPFFLVQKALPLLQRAARPLRPARVINVGSIAGINAMARPSYAYAASKAGLHHLTRLMARNLAPDITVNAIAPGAFETDMIAFALQNRAALEGLIPMSRVGQAPDIAGVALFLASRAAAYLTGAVLPVDGGMALKNP